MKKINFLALITFSIFLINCGPGDKKSESENNSDKKEVNQMELVVEFKSSVNDRFKIYYTIAPNDEITGDHMLANYTFGSNEIQKTTFTFPKGELPYKLRLDVGENQSNDKISLKNITINYKNKSIDGDNGKFMSYWSLNESIKYDENNFIYNLISINGKKTPVLMANDDLLIKLQKIHK